VVYNSSSLSGQIAAVESGLAVAVLTQCSAPPHLQILGREQQLGPREPLEPMAVALYRSWASKESLAVGSLYESLLRTLRTSAADPFAYRDPEQR
jgi:DNA-binding transcriptional LysR family regulator